MVVEIKIFIKTNTTPTKNVFVEHRQDQTMPHSNNSRDAYITAIMATNVCAERTKNPMQVEKRLSTATQGHIVSSARWRKSDCRRHKEHLLEKALKERQ